MNDIGLLNALGAKIKYLGKSQEVIAQNVANADTPGYRPQQLTAVDFAALLGRAAPTQNAALLLDRTAPGHRLPAGVDAASATDRPQKITYEVAPAGNAVILEEQLVKANAVRMDYDLMVNLYSRNMQMMRTALGQR
jgi:flagellar basal-body rod protein FlgB